MMSFLPLYAIGTTVPINLLLALINIGSSVGFGAFLSITMAYCYSSTMLVAAVMLHKRLTAPANKIQWGPFKMGWAVILVTVTALSFSVLGGAFSMWPTEIHPSIEEINWRILVSGGALIFKLIKIARNLLTAT